jgi:hypothetical protein
MSLPSHKFTGQPCCFHKLKVFKKYPVEVASNGNLNKISQVVQNLKRGDIQKHTHNTGTSQVSVLC